MNAAAKKITKARSALILDDPFWGSLAMRLEMRPDPMHPTAWVDGRTMGYNPSFVLSLDHEEIKALIAHEVGHCALGHPWRKSARDHGRWNEACDRALNPELTRAGFKLPEGALGALALDHVGKSAEWIYDRLPSQPEAGQGSGSGQPDQAQTGAGGARQAGPGSGQGSQGHPGSQDDPGASTGSQGNPLGEVREAPSPGAGDGAGQGTGSQGRQAPGDGQDGENGSGQGSETVPSEEDWRQAVVQAALAAKAQGQGSLPAGVERLVGIVSRPKVDWRSATRRFAQEQARSDYSWRRPNPRYLASGVYVPALLDEAAGVFAVAVDTSGSVDEVLLSQFEAEIRAVSDEVKPREIRVLYCDAKVHRQETFERNEPVVLKPCGGGGTDFRPVFEAIASWDEEPACVIYLTDLYGRFPEKAPDVPVLWVTGAENDRVAPFGETLAAT